MTRLDIFVPGTPKPKGSWRAITSKTTGKAFLVPNDPKSKPWQYCIRADVMGYWSGGPKHGPMRLTLTFEMPRPKSHYRTGKHAHKMRDDAPVWCDKKPDLDKLERTVLDALTGIVYTDDSQVVSVLAQKPYANDRHPGVRIIVEEL